MIAEFKGVVSYKHASFGEAKVLFEGESEGGVMREGDWVVILAHCKHKVTWNLKTRPPTPSVFIVVKWSRKVIVITAQKQAFMKHIPIGLLTWAFLRSRGSICSQCQPT